MAGAVAANFGTPEKGKLVTWSSSVAIALFAITNAMAELSICFERWETDEFAT